MKSSTRRLKKCSGCVTRSLRQPISVSSLRALCYNSLGLMRAAHAYISRTAMLDLRADRIIAELEATRDLSQYIVHVDMDAFYANVEVLPFTLLDHSSPPSRELFYYSQKLLLTNYLPPLLKPADSGQSFARWKSLWRAGWSSFHSIV